MTNAVDKQRAQQRERGRRFRERDRLGLVVRIAGDRRGKHGNHVRGVEHYRWKGGRFVTSGGYVAVRVEPDHPHAWGASATCRYAYEHILIAEATIGRALRDDELVHHENEDKIDNRPENLKTITIAEHAREHSARRGRDELGRFPPADMTVREFPAVRS